MYSFIRPEKLFRRITHTSDRAKHVAFTDSPQNRKPPFYSPRGRQNYND
jgi:hypothetical protein